MSQEDIPVQSIKALVNACIIAVLLAVVILLVFVLPAEYGIDPTDLGTKMGLTVLAGQSKAAVKLNADACVNVQQPPSEKMATVAPAAPSSDIRPLGADQAIQWKNTVKIEIPANKGLEYKFSLKKDASLTYSWTTDGQSLYFDFHGEPKGATDGYFKSYLIMTDSQSKGVFTAPFEGIHGWYWENGTNQPVTVQLSTDGDYQALGIIE